MKPSELAPPKAANLLNRASQLSQQIHGGDRFPIDIDAVAKGAAELFNWKDPITQIEPVNLTGFEGMLASNESKTKWMMAYNETLSSEGRIRFTKAHELGHYMLHRDQKPEFMCSKDDLLNGETAKNIEAEADTFASYLLMPLDDFRLQMNGDINFDSFNHCTDRYGVSLTAAILKWLSYTDEKAILVRSNDGFMEWACASNAAKKAGAYFKTRNRVIPVPEGTLTSNTSVREERFGARIAAKRWFPYADSAADLTEMKIYSEQYDCTLSLLLLPKYIDCWPPMD